MYILYQAQFYVKKLSLLAQLVYVFLVILIINSSYFPKQYSPILMLYTLCIMFISPCNDQHLRTILCILDQILYSPPTKF